MQKMQVQALGWDDPLEEAWQPTPVLLPGESCGLRNVVGYSALGHKESATTEAREHSMHGNAHAPVKTGARIGMPYYYLRPSCILPYIHSY